MFSLKFNHKRLLVIIAINVAILILLGRDFIYALTVAIAVNIVIEIIRFIAYRALKGQSNA